MGEALATGNPLPKAAARLAVVATLCTVVPGTVPGLMLSWGSGIVKSEATGVAADCGTRAEASCSGGRSELCSTGIGVVGTLCTMDFSFRVFCVGDLVGIISVSLGGLVTGCFLEVCGVESL